MQAVHTKYAFFLKFVFVLVFVVVFAFVFVFVFVLAYWIQVSPPKQPLFLI